jgi:Rrf2 family protein
VKLSSQEEYGLRCLVQLGRKREGGSLTIAELSRLEGISQPNVAKIMRLLRQAGFVVSSRGQAGGYTLARPAADINAAEVLAGLGGRLFDDAFCDRHSGGVEDNCFHLGGCSIRPVLAELQRVVDHVLGRLTLEQLLRPENEVVVRTQPQSVRIPVVSRPS